MTVTVVTSKGTDDIIGISDTDDEENDDGSECEIVLESLHTGLSGLYAEFGTNIKAEDIELVRPPGCRGAWQRVKDVIASIEASTVSSKMDSYVEESDSNDESICLDDLDDEEIMTNGWNILNDSKAKLNGLGGVNTSLFNITPKMAISTPPSVPAALKKKTIASEKKRECLPLKPDDCFFNAINEVLEYNQPTTLQDCKDLVNERRSSTNALKILPDHHREGKRQFLPLGSDRMSEFLTDVNEVEGSYNQVKGLKSLMKKDDCHRYRTRQSLLT